MTRFKIPDPLYGLIRSAIGNPVERQTIYNEVEKLTLDHYQAEAMKTAVFPEDTAVIYTALGLTNEAGEYCGKLKKKIRGDTDVMTWDEVGEYQEDTLSELGDVLWYIAACAEAQGVKLSDLADKNLKKLKDRQARGVIKGNGDTR